LSASKFVCAAICLISPTTAPICSAPRGKTGDLFVGIARFAGRRGRLFSRLRQLIADRLDSNSKATAAAIAMLRALPSRSAAMERTEPTTTIA
jgi:hypothetical protein